MEITTYLEKSMTSELSGNVIDLCPVGALTSKPYAFEARPWELKKTESIDVMDAVGSNIRVDSYGWEVKRVLPRLNNSINEEWISDKTRYACDGLLKQRLDKVYIRRENKLVEASWDDAINLISSKINSTDNDKIAGHIGGLNSIETINSFKKFLEEINVKNYEFREKDFYVNPEEKMNYIFNSSIQGIEKSDLLLLVGANPRLEATILNARIRKTYLKNKLPIFSIGDPGDLTYPYKVIGKKTDDIKQILDGKSEINNLFKKSKNPLVIIGESALELKSGKYILEGLKDFLHKNKFINENWNSFNILSQNAATVGALDLNFLNKANGSGNFFDKLKNHIFELLYFVGSDELNFQKNNEFIIYQGSHGDRMAEIADVVLPSPAYTEQNGFFINLEGRLQKAYKATNPIGNAKEDWKIFNLICNKLKNKNLFTNYKDLIDDSLSKIKDSKNIDTLPVTQTKKINLSSGNFYSEDVSIRPIDYYFSNPVARASKTMSDCRGEKILNIENRKIG